MCLLSLNNSRTLHKLAIGPGRQNRELFAMFSLPCEVQMIENPPTPAQTSWSLEEKLAWDGQADKVAAVKQAVCFWQNTSFYLL